MGKKNIAKGKVITCCYCGVQSSFLPNRDLHALICSTCGAPLSMQKKRPLAEHKGAKMPEAGTRHNYAPGFAQSEKPLKVKTPQAKLSKSLKQLKKLKKKKKKSLFGKVFDLAEDVFDEIFD